MGVWNATCGVSSLPIRSGRVHAFPLAWHPPTFGEDDFSYGPTSLATPISLPILGAYDSYGAIDGVVEGPLERQLFGHLGGLHTRGELSLTGGPFPETLEELLKCAAEGRTTAKVLLGGSDGVPSSVRELVISLMLVDERVYEAVLTAVRESRDWEAERRVGGPRGPKDARAAMDKMCRRNRNLDFYRLGADVTSELLVRMGELHDFELALELLRRCYAPPTGAGSQSTAYGFHAATAAAIQRIAQENAAESA
jgi:hypothetical protein